MKSILTDIPTYRIGLLQTKAYKVIMGTTARILSKYSISNTEWVALGLIYDHPDGLRSAYLAKMMGIEQPFITLIAVKMGEYGYFKIITDPSDRRAKIIKITPKGKLAVRKIESNLSNEMQKLVELASAEQARVYLSVLQLLANQSSKSNSF